MDAKSEEVTMTLSRVAHMAKTSADRERKIEAAHHYYGRFDNVFTGPGIVNHGMIEPLPCKTPIKELGDSLLIGTPQEIIDKLAPYAELGIDRVILNLNFGLEPSETRDTIASFAEEVMPHF
jgi:alkanesulfonate monooxygenase SsuD/methylene tetrahydromethanopterin reductase-like flavin-dependent oxidoreductase (luciferase family)